VSWAPDYTTVARVKSYLRIDDTVDDVFLGAWISAASRNIDEHCLRQFGQVDAPEEREYRGEYDRECRRWVYHIDDLPDRDALDVVTADGTVVTGWTLEPGNAVQRGKPYERLLSTTCGPLTMTAPWGWATAPPSIEVGLWLFGARLAARRDSPFGIAGSPSEGSELRLLAKLDPDMITVLKPFRRFRGAAA